LDLPLAAPGPVDVIARVVNHHGIEGDRIPDASAATILPELDAPWLDTPRAGVVPPGSTAWLYVWIGQLTRRGTYRAELRIETDDPRHPTMRVPVTVHVT